MTTLRYTCLLVGWAFASGLHAQGVSAAADSFFRQKIPMQSFDRQEWSRVSASLDYSQRKEPDASGTGFSLPDLRLGNLGPIVRAVTVVAAVALLLFLIYRITDDGYAFRPGDKKIRPSLRPDDMAAIEADLPDADLAHPLANAITAGDYPLAVRLHYLTILQLLARQGRITWKREKTNGEYLRELPPADWASAVADATRTFEQVWYGETRLSETAYRSVDNSFRQLRRRLAGADTGSGGAET